MFKQATKTIKESNKQTIQTQDEPQWIVAQDYSHTYNTWIRLSRFQEIYHCQSLKLTITKISFGAEIGSYATGPGPNAYHLTMKVVHNTA